MKTVTVMLVACGMPALAEAQSAAIRLAPDDAIYFNITNARRGYADLVVQTISVGNTGNTPLQFEGLRISVEGGSGLLTEFVPAERALANSAEYAGMMEAGMDVLIAAQTLNPDGLSGLFGQDMQASPDPHLGGGEAVLTNSYHFSTGFRPQRATITAMLRDESCDTFNVSETIPVIQYQPAISYSAPVDGVWLMHAIPGIQSHHRLNLVTEFAVDFFRVDEAGQAYAGDDPLDLDAWYGYGAPVRAAADGEVVFVINDQYQDRAAMMRQEGESREEAGRRIQRHNFMRMRENFRAAAAGNLVTIRHEENGVVEYTSYGHLAADSVTVQIGDLVEQGQIIGTVGDTGDSAAVHLHFQVNAGPDAFLSRSLPAVFTDLEPVEASLDPGRFVVAPDRD